MPFHLSRVGSGEGARNLILLSLFGGLIFVGLEQEIVHPWAGISPREQTCPELSESLLAHFSPATEKKCLMNVS